MLDCHLGLLEVCGADGEDEGEVWAGGDVMHYHHHHYHDDDDDDDGETGSKGVDDEHYDGSFKNCDCDCDL